MSAETQMFLQSIMLLGMTGYMCLIHPHASEKSYLLPFRKIIFTASWRTIVLHAPLIFLLTSLSDARAWIYISLSALIGSTLFSRQSLERATIALTHRSEGVYYKNTGETDLSHSSGNIWMYSCLSTSIVLIIGFCLGLLLGYIAISFQSLLLIFCANVLTESINPKIEIYVLKFFAQRLKNAASLDVT